ncbi:MULTISPECIES: hypothetical protein [Rhizobium/Agrobacterium group]|uniref:Lipoprotein n=1 Tax=Agrobacterium vitis TaxID=373 RepID=A0ABD6H991_AGRVI|nr:MULTISPECIES: hypothetical protein [Rhizobium/Agrobacterium group]MUO30041.1 hypothetical protein [Agrobacterium vitis]MUO42405.1 hypothetical protein [Agrobacterium vitis]MUP10681.1 hypothetical protein [Agrobacterium vitis]MVA24501.1 hypothetical protein [Agrobacterium vitis]
MQNLIIFVLLGVLAGCQNVDSSSTAYVANYPIRPYAIDKEDAAAIEIAVRNELKDPLSAILGEARATIDGKNVVHVCGMVNARNSFGGYTGFVLYQGILATNVYNKRVFAVIGMGGSPGDIPSQSIAIMCKRNGIN